jgi:hypothetical protein
MYDLTFKCPFTSIVCGATGSGKTTPAIIGITKALKENKVAIYTSPIKSLSNQKYNDFNQLFPGNVGIITGDVKISPTSPLMIVTAEILKNIFVYDYYWRLFRNLKIRSIEELKKYSVSEINAHIYRMLDFQIKVPSRFLKRGLISKMFMTLSYLRFLFSFKK